MPAGGVDEAVAAIRAVLPRALRGRATVVFGAEGPEEWERPLVGDAPFWTVRVALHDDGWGHVVGSLRPRPGGRLGWSAWCAHAEGDESYWPAPGQWTSQPDPVAPPASWEKAVARDITAAALWDLAQHAVAPHEIRSDGVIWHGRAQLRPLDGADDLRGAAAALAAGLEATVWAVCTRRVVRALRIIGVDVDADEEALAAAQEVTLTGPAGTLTMTLEHCGRAWNKTPTPPRVKLTMVTDAHGEEHTTVRSGALWRETTDDGRFAPLTFWPGDVAGPRPRRQGVRIAWR